MEKLKLLTMTLLLFFFIVASVLYVNLIDVKTYEDMIDVGKVFSYCLMIGDADGMKRRASNELIKKIDKRKYEQVEENQDDYDGLEIANLRAFGNTVVCTYALRYPAIMIYSVVLETNPIRTYWEKARFFLSSTPILERFIESPKFKARWYVVEYYTESNYAQYTKEDLKEFNLISQLPASLEGSYWKEWDKLLFGDESKLEILLNAAEMQEAKWSKEEIIKQYRATASLIKQHILTIWNQKQKVTEEKLLREYLEKAKNIRRGERYPL
ncbi:MAG: hypothetical protein WC624_01205 [Candidatus Margulisiibacteriota bacterium]